MSARLSAFGHVQQAAVFQSVSQCIVVLAFADRCLEEHHLLACSLLAILSTCFDADILLGDLIFHSEYGSDILLRNVG
jgi:hypothetical protein